MNSVLIATVVAVPMAMLLPVVLLLWAEVKELRKRLAAAEVDAARYRWLRDNGNITWSLDFEEMIVSFEVDPDITEAAAAGLDAAIDAARGEV